VAVYVKSPPDGGLQPSTPRLTIQPPQLRHRPNFGFSSPTLWSATFFPELPQFCYKFMLRHAFSEYQVDIPPSTLNTCDGCVIPMFCDCFPSFQQLNSVSSEYSGAALSVVKPNGVDLAKKSIFAGQLCVGRRASGAFCRP
jgi:hypothetical protein